MRRNLIFVFLFLFVGSFVWGVQEFKAKDHPSDNGTAIDLCWQLPRYVKTASQQEPVLLHYNSFVIEKQDSLGNWIKLKELHPEETHYTDSDNIAPGQNSNYRFLAYAYELRQPLTFEAQTVSFAQWYDYKKTPLLIMIVLLCGAVIYYILAAKKGRDLFIRKINGLESMDEAVGRATEKGKPILFVPGIGDLDDIQTIAGLTILSQLAYKAATYNADLLVPVSKSMVLSTAREIVKEAYLKAGKPDMYNQDKIFYLTDDQFGYVAGIDGIMIREQPAANFFLGTFYAEALILAETGFGTGAMQTAGTAQPHQLPFFVVTCDYTLIGEELFAASAYLSKAPDQLGSLKGQDLGKLVIVVFIILGVVLEIAGIPWLKTLLTLE
ncbi:MAG: DUF6754 domain-containing protein [Candidatus Cloacimonadaceae bacterium]